MKKTYISHHGVLGQQWGRQNGPPYPIDAGAHSASEKKAGWQKSLSKGKTARPRHVGNGSSTVGRRGNGLGFNTGAGTGVFGGGIGKNEDESLDLTASAYLSEGQEQVDLAIMEYLEKHNNRIGEDLLEAFVENPLTRDDIKKGLEADAKRYGFKVTGELILKVEKIYRETRDRVVEMYKKQQAEDKISRKKAEQSEKKIEAIDKRDSGSNSVEHGMKRKAYIAHHGVLGQEWGRRNGPPYPLDASAHSSREKSTGWQKSLSKGKTARSSGKGSGVSLGASGGSGSFSEEEMKKMKRVRDSLWQMLLSEMIRSGERTNQGVLELLKDSKAKELSPKDLKELANSGIPASKILKGLNSNQYRWIASEIKRATNNYIHDLEKKVNSGKKSEEYEEELAYNSQTNNSIKQSGIISHHGVLGQRKGIRNGPPYPLSRQQFHSLTNDQLRSIIETLELEVKYRELEGKIAADGAQYVQRKQETLGRKLENLDKAFKVATTIYNLYAGIHNNIIKNNKESDDSSKKTGDDSKKSK